MCFMAKRTMLGRGFQAMGGASLRLDEICVLGNWETAANGAGLARRRVGSLG